jgi:hypothetical protein
VIQKQLFRGKDTVVGVSMAWGTQKTYGNTYVDADDGAFLLVPLHAVNGGLGLKSLARLPPE